MSESAFPLDDDPELGSRAKPTFDEAFDKAFDETHTPVKEFERPEPETNQYAPPPIEGDTRAALIAINNSILAVLKIPDYHAVASLVQTAIRIQELDRSKK